MIRKITARHFKQFSRESFDLRDSITLAGPNNSGKSTLLQAIATWKFGLDHWMSRRAGTSARRRSGVPMTRLEFTAVPLREMNLLWEDRRVAPRASEPRDRRFIEIVVEGRSEGTPWRCGLEFQYANPETIYVRPLNAKGLSKADFDQFPPPQALELEVLHVPALSGIERHEARMERGMQDLLVAQGFPGQVLRNLLFEISQQEGPDWDELSSLMQELFGIALERPVYRPAMPYIVCEYRDSPRNTLLDLSSAGSGTLQVLLLLAFLYSRPASVILLDEPDAHQHVILQRQVYLELLKLARRRQAQLIVATHSEVLLDSTEPTHVYAFLGHAHRPLANESERDQLREALKRITTTELLLAREIGSVLYVEGPTDELILTEWARVLEHPALEFFRRPFVHPLGGRDLREAKAHFFAIRAAIPGVRAVCLLDGDSLNEPDHEVQSAGLVVIRWRRYEIENYLLHPEAIKRFVRAPLIEDSIEEGFWQHVPKGTDLCGDHVALQRVKASDEFLLPLLRGLDLDVSKRDLHGIAATMEAVEIHPEVRDKLDRIADCLVPGLPDR